EAKVRPVLAANCYDCHTEEHFGGLRVDSREGLLKGGSSGPAIVPGDPDKSLLIQAVRQTSDKPKMPKGGRLRPEEVDAPAARVRAGAPWPAAATTTASAAKSDAPGAAPAPARPTTPPYVISDAQRAFWSFQPIKKVTVPGVAKGSWPKTDVDR